MAAIGNYYNLNSKKRKFRSLECVNGVRAQVDYYVLKVEIEEERRDIGRITCRWEWTRRSVTCGADDYVSFRCVSTKWYIS
ncbi:hypothetical transcript [Echinococcus multilocularis]|uniref:Hypothetical transcript n=1 Tax=Echinococcus multilocularis TaxID=6211 RepID=A0A0S4MQT4_ECHMU|nr:hypothetical transcript [Echinococcus multilocularis]